MGHSSINSHFLWHYSWGTVLAGCTEHSYFLALSILFGKVILCLLVCKEDKWISKAYCHDNMTIGVPDQSITTWKLHIFNHKFSHRRVIFRVTQPEGLMTTDNQHFQICTRPVATSFRLSFRPLMCGGNLQNWGSPSYAKPWNFSHAWWASSESLPFLHLASQTTWSFWTAILVPRRAAPSGGRGGNHGPGSPLQIFQSETFFPHVFTKDLLDSL